ncbi:MAG: NAD(P)/FAD-dependent oxidoreductase, partial [Williamsia sp.]|nr:NAD(P)/FAD-dependent oxidoreductase [Williamsia sp.]
MNTSTNTRVVVIGNGMVGYKFCEKLVAKEKSGKRFTLTVFGEEPRVAYDRVHLSAYFAGKTAEDLTLAPVDWYVENGIKLYLTDPVVDINREQKVVRSHHGVVVPYDYLILATGSGAFVPPVAGVEKDGVFVYRTIEDLELIQSYARKAKKGAVLGG